MFENEKECTVVNNSYRSLELPSTRMQIIDVKKKNSDTMLDLVELKLLELTNFALDGARSAQHRRHLGLLGSESKSKIRQSNNTRTTTHFEFGFRLE
jgi:hypothetical protein